MIVAVGMFTVLMLLIMGAFLSVTDASRKTRSTRVALDNVSAAVDYMAREIRLGSYFRRSVLLFRVTLARGHLLARTLAR
jgi:hypothetical protein